MPHLLYFLFVCLFLVGCAGPQQTAGISDSAAPQGAEVITVHTDLEADAAYRKAARVLQQRGYTFRSTDETLRSIATDYIGITKTFGVYDGFARVSANVQGDEKSRVVLRGWWSVEGDQDTGEAISKYGRGGSPVREGWKELHQIATAIGDSLTYK